MRGSMMYATLHRTSDSVYNVIQVSVLRFILLNQTKNNNILLFERDMLGMQVGLNFERCIEDLLQQLHLLFLWKTAVVFHVSCV